jgi:hypothetical protein
LQRIEGLQKDPPAVDPSRPSSIQEWKQQQLDWQANYFFPRLCNVMAETIVTVLAEREQRLIKELRCTPSPHA